jgi:chromate transporter
VSERRSRLLEVAAVSAKLGVLGFGGPAAHVALLRTEVVERRQWISDPEFVDLLGATSALPGPGSTQMVIAVGRRRAGWAGLLVAGTCFIAPATAIVLVLAWLYVSYGHLPAVGGVLYGVKPVVVAVIVMALCGLVAGAARTGAAPVVVAAGAAGGFLAGADPLVVLAVGAVALMVWRNAPRLGARGSVAGVVLPAVASSQGRGAGAVAARRTEAAAHVGLWPLVREFAKLGVIVFGSGYVLLAFLQRDLVHQLHWIGARQLLDAVAAGQVTPGPVFTTATFVGYLVRGVPGALLATLAIFLPSFVMVAVLVPVLPRLRRSSWASGALDGAGAAAVGLMAGVAVPLGRAAVVDPLTAVMAVVGLAALARFRVNTAWLVLAGAVVGVLHSL